MRTLLLIDASCATRVPETVARLGVSPRSQVTVVALPRMPPLWPMASLSGVVTLDEMHRTALEEATSVLRRVVDVLPATCSVEHRVLAGRREFAAMLRERTFGVMILSARPGRGLRRLLAGAGTALVHAH